MSLCTYFPYYTISLTLCACELSNFTNDVTDELLLQRQVQSGAAYHSQGFEDKNLGSSPGLLGQ